MRVGRRVTVLDQRQQHELGYDYLIYALGSMTDRNNIPRVDQYAYTLSARGPFSAEALRQRLPAIRERGGQGESEAEELSFEPSNMVP